MEEQTKMGAARDWCVHKNSIIAIAGFIADLGNRIEFCIKSFIYIFNVQLYEPTLISISHLFRFNDVYVPKAFYVGQGAERGINRPKKDPPETIKQRDFPQWNTSHAFAYTSPTHTYITQIVDHKCKDIEY